jgi:hypothetical protein
MNDNPEFSGINHACAILMVYAIIIGGLAAFL